MVKRVREWVKADRREWTERLNLLQTTLWCVGILIWVPGLVLWLMLLTRQL